MRKPALRLLAFKPLAGASRARGGNVQSRKAQFFRSLPFITIAKGRNVGAIRNYCETNPYANGEARKLRKGRRGARFGDVDTQHDISPAWRALLMAARQVVSSS
jgi:hypothetical protein